MAYVNSCRSVCTHARMCVCVCVCVCVCLCVWAVCVFECKYGSVSATICAFICGCLYMNRCVYLFLSLVSLFVKLHFFHGNSKQSQMSGGEGKLPFWIGLYIP